ncbi:MAG: vWA domain-containing protein [Chloroflexota bacterium]
MQKSTKTEQAGAGAEITAATDRTVVRAHHHSRRYACIEVTAPAATATATRPTVNVAFVLDRSGSMSGRNKFGLATAAIREGIGRLQKDDRLTIVAFDTEVDVVAPATRATAEGKAAAIAALERIGPRGGTDLAGGWLRGAEQVAAGMIDDGVNRVILLTDGQANHGMTDSREIETHAAGLRVRGIASSTLGVGEDHDEALLGGMADAGGGTFRFIGRPEEIGPAIAQEVGELLEVTARGAVVRLTGPAGIHVETLSPFPIERAGGTTTITLGDMVADQVIRVIVTVDFPMGEVGTEIGLVAELADRSGRLTGGSTLTWRFADNRTNDTQPRDRAVDRVVARTFADRALRDVTEMNRRHDWEGARNRLLSVAARVAEYAGEDAELRAIVVELREAAELWSVVRSELDLKGQYARSASSLKSRLVEHNAAPRRRGH